MRIIVRSQGFKLWLPVPTGLLFSDLTAAFLPRIMAQNGVTITKEQAVTLMRGIRKCKRRHRGLTLVEAQTANGDYVEIKL